MQRERFSVSVVEMAILLVFGTGTIFAAYPDHTFTTDGTIQAGDSYEDVFVEGCTVDMIGGFINSNLDVSDNGIVNYYGGKIYYWSHVYDSSIFNVYDDTDGGWGICGITGYGTSKIYVTGGKVENNINATDNCFVDVSSGFVREITASYDGVVHLTGGEVQRMGASGSGIINIYGYGFEYIPGGSTYINEDLFRGYFGDGTEFNISLYYLTPGDLTYDHIVTHIVPEPCTWGLMILGGICLIRRRRFRC